MIVGSKFICFNNFLFIFENGRENIRKFKSTQFID